MKKKLLLLTLCISIVSFSYAQTRVNYALSKKISESENRSELLHVLVKGDVEEIASLVKAGGGNFKYSSGNIASVAITIEQIAALLGSNAIERIEAFPPTYHPMNDTVLLNTNTLDVHAGTAPLSQGYDGTGVITGFIDTGIDWTHEDFNDIVGYTRIKYIWDQGALPVSAPIGYGYGIEWDSTSIADGICTHTDAIGTPFVGHGTHVVGKAAGSAEASGQFLGIAPKSDIIVVALDFTGAAPATALSDAVKYIYDKALAIGKPCVINASLGTDVGSHDGQDLESQLISSLIDANPGQAFVAAAGNSGEVPYHLGYTVTADTNFTMFTPSNDTVYMEIYADTNDLKNVEFAWGADQMSPSHSFRGRTSFFNVDSSLNVLYTENIMNGANRIAQVLSSTELVGGTYYTWFAILSDSAGYNFRFMTTTSSTGKFDAWNFDATNGMAAKPIVNTGLPSLATMPDSAYYKLPDLEQTIASGIQCLENVIAVGNYYNRKSYVDVNLAIYTDPNSIVGELHGTSASGPTRDGRIKPDIAAPGHMTIAAAESSWSAANPASNILAQGGLHSRNGFTSHSAPAVAGIAALYLQKNPLATARQVHQAIINCPIQDEFTGNCLPDNQWGYGKVNAFGALNEILTTTQPRDSSICEGSDATFTTEASGTGLSYQWVMELNDTCTDLANSAIYSGVTTNTLTISAASLSLTGSQYRCVVSNNFSCDVTSAIGTLTVNAIPTIASAASTNNSCFSGSAQSTDITYTTTTNSPTTYSLTWDATAITAGFATINDNPLAASPISISIPASAAAATYTATITVKNANSCVSSPGNDFTLTILPLPTITIDTSASICFNAAAQNTSLTYSAQTNLPTSYSLSWDATATSAGFLPVNDAVLSTSPITIAVPAGAAAATYTATITVKNDSSCVSSPGNDFTVTVLPAAFITATAGSNTTICTNTSLTVNGATTTGDSILWTHNGNGTLNDANTLSPTYLPAMTDTSNQVILTMAAMGTSACGTATATAFDTVIVSSLPSVGSTGLASTYCYDAKAVTLTGIPSGGTFGGTAGITNSSTGTFEPIVAGTGAHTVIYSYTDGSNCSNTASQSTTIFSYAMSKDSCQYTTDFKFDENFSNNIFTPNNDGDNDEFELNFTGTPSSDFNLSIFDRWGNQLFTTANPNIKWDGRTTAGIKVGNGTYFYILVNAGINYKGYLTLFE